MPRGRLEKIVTVVLALLLAGVIAWRFGAFARSPAEAARDDPFQILAVWESGGRPQVQSIVLPRAQIAGQVAAGRLFETIEQIPGTPFSTSAYLAFRYVDEALVTPSIQPRAVEGGNRCLMVIGAETVSRLGGPLTAVVTLKSELPEQPLCG